MNKIIEYVSANSKVEETIEDFYSETKEIYFISEPYLCKKAHKVSIYVYEEKEKVEKIAKLNIV